MFSVTSMSKPEFLLPCPPLGMVRAAVCSKGTYDIIRVICEGCGSPVQIKRAIEEISDIDAALLGIAAGTAFLRAYRDTLESYCDRNKDFYAFPERLDFEAMNAEKSKLPIMTWAENLVHLHTGLNFREIAELDILDYRLLFADAVKLTILSRADGEGKKHLNECYDYMHSED
ncbi:MAG: hypothetical protein ACI4KF_02580 [Huintestinicola sp.]